MKKLILFTILFSAFMAVSGQKPATTSGKITLAFVGDVMMGTTFPDSVTRTHLPPKDGRDLFKDCNAIIQNADASFLNVEGTFLDGPGKRKKMKDPKFYYVFRMPTAYVWNLKNAGFDFAGIANNHINDFGLPGINSTIKTLQKANILTSGLTQRLEAVYGKFRDKTIGFAQFGHSSGTLSILDMNEVRRVVGDMKNKADIVVVSFHGGAEGSDKTIVPREMEMFAGDKRGDVYKFAHTAIDAGADIVVGHGPHVPRGMEIYKNRLIAYSLGNFCTPFRVNLQGISGYAPLLEVELNSDGSFAGGKIHSFIQRRGVGPRTDPRNLSAKLIKKLSESQFPSSKLKISLNGTLSR